jgi:CRP-like cAMP-binding protein
MAEYLCVNKVPLFNHLTYKEQFLIHNLFKHKEFRKGDIVFSPESEKELYIVASGQMKVYTLSSTGREEILRIVEAGGYEGEKNLLGLPNDSYYGEAINNTKICCLLKADFDYLSQTYPKIINKLLYLNAKKLMELERHTHILSMEHIDKRLAFYLIELTRIQKSKNKIKIPIPLYELASLLGTRAETLSRKLKYFESNNLIKRTGKDIHIISIENLQKVIY